MKCETLFLFITLSKYDQYLLHLWKGKLSTSSNKFCQVWCNMVNFEPLLGQWKDLQNFINDKLFQYPLLCARMWLVITTACSNRGSGHFLLWRTSIFSRIHDRKAASTWQLNHESFCAKLTTLCILSTTSQHNSKHYTRFSHSRTFFDRVSITVG